MTDSGADDLVARAREFCISAHAGQTRDNGEPYATHPIVVADILRDSGVTDPDILAAAYLHDVLEDTQHTAEELREAFGPGVTEMVEQMTNRGWPGRTHEQKQQGLLDEAARMSDRTKLIKLADRLNNLSQMGIWPVERRRQYARDTMALLEALRPWPSEALAGRVREIARREIPPGEAGGGETGD